MTEEFIQFIWKYGLFEHNNLFTDSGDAIQVISLGEQNQDSGPDFLNARLKIGNTTWAGNVEIHTCSSDWYAHGHEADRAYDNVVLHVVHRHDRPVMRPGGEMLPTLVLPFDETLYGTYRELISNPGSTVCRGKLERVDALGLDCWLSSLAVERLARKSDHIAQQLQQSTGNWEETFYVSMARSFGFGLNSAPFEWVARSLPLTILSRHRDNPVQTEALLLGQAGFLDESSLYPGYPEILVNEYAHLRRKYKLRPIGKHLWKFLRLRPVNFPTIRLAQFANLLQRSDGFFSQVVACRDVHELMTLFSSGVSEFWKTHYTFGKTSPYSRKKMGEGAVYSIIMNTVIPFLFVYGTMNGREEYRDKALDWLNRIPPETNRVIRSWKNAGVYPVSALYSQALLQLSENYCKRRRCLSCYIGTHLITLPH